jgi:hypothetical protein
MFEGICGYGNFLAYKVALAISDDVTRDELNSKLTSLKIRINIFF